MPQTTGNSRPLKFGVVGCGSISKKHLAALTGGDLADAGVLPHGALAAREGRIVWVGPEEALQREVRLLPGGRTLDAGGRAVLPGFVDPHTHLPWAGDRAGEFAERLAGATYQEIAARGGGILGTVAATREASEDELVEVTPNHIRLRKKLLAEHERKRAARAS